jgi:hypothetical protein
MPPISSRTLRTAALYATGIGLVSLLLAMAVLREVPCIDTSCCGQHGWLSPLMGPGFYALLLLVLAMLAGIGWRQLRVSAVGGSGRAAGAWLLLSGQFLVAVGYAGADNLLEAVQPVAGAPAANPFCAVAAAPPTNPLLGRPGAAP